MRVMMVGAAAITILGSVSVASAGDKDDAIETRIESRLSHDARLKERDVKVDIDNGVATLKGKVPTEADRLRAERLARVTGITRIENKIEIDTSAAKDRIDEEAVRAKKAVDERAEQQKERIGENADRAKARIDDKAKDPHATRVEPRVDHVDNRRTDVDRVDNRRTVERVDNRVDNRRTTTAGNDTAGEEITDAWITTKVKTQFAGAEGLGGSDISVDTNQKGVVTLTGTVPNETARARAVEIARKTKGVRQVVDSLKTTIPVK